MLWQMMPKVFQGKPDAGKRQRCCARKYIRGQPRSIPGGKLLADRVVLKNVSKMATPGNLSWCFSYKKGGKYQKRSWNEMCV